jgi:hypothetical protein
MSNGDDEKFASRVALAIVRSAEMEETQDYLARGRRFSGLTADALNDAWATAFKDVFSNENRSRVRDLDDLGAELRLRELELPEHLVAPEMAGLRERLIREGPLVENPELDRRIDEFFAGLRKPSN